MPRKQNNEPFLKPTIKKKKQQKKEKLKQYGKYTQKHVRLTLHNLEKKSTTNTD